MSYKILEDTEINDIIEKSSLDSHTIQQTKQILESMGADTAADLFENFDEADININISTTIMTNTNIHDNTNANTCMDINTNRI